MPSSVKPTEPSISLLQFLRSARDQLRDAGIENAELDAKILIQHALSIDQTRLFMEQSRTLTADEIKKITTLLEARALHKPVARILGRRDFWGLSFELNEATLEPRPDSETLIEITLKRTASFAPPLSVLDLGTGSGCLLLSLLQEWPTASGVGTDQSVLALHQAAQNAKKLGLSDRARFEAHSWLQNLEGSYDVIVSNPPYIKTRDLLDLMPEVRDHDPKLALDGGSHGLTAYETLIPHLSHFLKPNGFTAFEIGFDQGKDVSQIFSEAGFIEIETTKDLAGLDRVVSAYMP